MYHSDTDSCILSSRTSIRYPEIIAFGGKAKQLSHTSFISGVESISAPPCSESDFEVPEPETTTDIMVQRVLDEIVDNAVPVSSGETLKVRGGFSWANEQVINLDISSTTSDSALAAAHSATERIFDMMFSHDQEYENEIDYETYRDEYYEDYAKYMKYEEESGKGGEIEFEKEAGREFEQGREYEFEGEFEMNVVEEIESGRKVESGEDTDWKTEEEFEEIGEEYQEELEEEEEQEKQEEEEREKKEPAMKPVQRAKKGGKKLPVGKEDEKKVKKVKIHKKHGKHVRYDDGVSPRDYRDNASVITVISSDSNEVPPPDVTDSYAQRTEPTTTSVPASISTLTSRFPSLRSDDVYAYEDTFSDATKKGLYERTDIIDELKAVGLMDLAYCGPCSPLSRPPKIKPITL